MPTNLSVVIFLGAAIPGAWYLYQIGSRKKQRLRYKLKQISLSLVTYSIAIALLRNHGFPELEVALISMLVGMGSAWLLVKPPKQERRIPTAVRREVIARDLLSKGLKWDPAKHHIDHVVPFSRGGDHSPRNLRVIEKQKNLRKGGKMPRVRDLMR